MTDQQNVQSHSSSSLSVDAPVFVPGGYAPTSGGSGDGGVPLTEVPSFMTSCYPFVQPDDMARNSGKYNMAVAGRGRGAGRGGKSRRGGLVPSPTGYPLPPWASAAGFPNNFLSNPPGMTFDGGTVLGDGLLPTPVFPGGCLQPGMNGFNHFNMYNVQQQQQVSPNSSLNGLRKDPRLTNAKKMANADTLTSPTFQGQGHGKLWPQAPHNYVTNFDNSQSKTRPRTIICKDISVQTDFSDELAALTLSEKPNALFTWSHARRRKEKSKTNSATYTSDSEVDSDSGYSSPLHRRNVRSNGTDPVSPLPTPESDKGRNILGRSFGNVSPPKAQPITYASIAQKTPKPVGPTPSQICDSARVTSLVDGADANVAPVNSETVTSEGGKKKRRRRNRRRKKKNADDDRQSDGLSVTGRTFSSSNVSRTSEVTLHFEDESEFPDLYQSNVESGHDRDRDSLSRWGTPVSFSQVVKSSQGSHVSRCSSWHSDECDLSREQTGDENTDTVQDGKQESKTARKRRKRREQANKAAEAELAEIGLEQQMLKEQIKQGTNTDTAKAGKTQKSSKQGGIISDPVVVQDAKSTKEGGGGKKSQQPIAFDIAAMITALEMLFVRGLPGVPPDIWWPAKKVCMNMMKRGMMTVYIKSDHAEFDVKIYDTTVTEKDTTDYRKYLEYLFVLTRKKKQSLLKAYFDDVDWAKQDLQPESQQNVQPSPDAGTSCITQNKKKKDSPEDKKAAAKKKEEKVKSGSSANLLDASAPAKRGKERENPKPKKPSPLKKVILKEREERKKMRLLEDDHDRTGSMHLAEAPVGIGVANPESDLSQDGLSSKSSVEMCNGASTSADLSPISQNSPISMSPLSPGASPLSSGVNSPITGLVHKDPMVKMKIHSRRFREYCTQVLDKDIDTCCQEFLQDLVRFQDRMFHKDPVKAKARRRIVLGLREVTKHLKLKKIKCVIISPNLEKIQSKGGLDDALYNILNMCEDQNIPFVFALGRRALGRACAKLVPVSCAGIFNFDGCEETFKKLMDYTQKARDAYKEMVVSIQKEIDEHPQRGPSSIYAHMGHSRTPSGCSVMSFTSSILSEPISENYPHSEPETDSKGYEIIKEPLRRVELGQVDTLRTFTAVDDIDDGNEADTEDCDLPPKLSPPIVLTEDIEEESDDDENDDDDDDDENDDDDDDEDDVESDSDTASSQHASDVVNELPHIDSIHSINYDLSSEILSQHSGRTIDRSEVMSTHSSRTLGDGSSTILTDMIGTERSKADVTKSCDSPVDSQAQRLKVCDKDRIQNWVDSSNTNLSGVGDNSDSDVLHSGSVTESENESEGQGYTRDTTLKPISESGVLEL